MPNTMQFQKGHANVKVRFGHQADATDPERRDHARCLGDGESIEQAAVSG